MRFTTTVAVALVVVAGGCTKGGEERAEATKRSSASVEFVDASEGLPDEGQWREHVAVADLDGDSKPEIIAPAQRGVRPLVPTIWSRGDDGVWEAWQTEYPGGPFGYGGVAVGDFDKDGRPDLAFASHAIGVTVLRNLGDRKFETLNEGLPPPKSFHSRALTVGDFDGDGWLDIVALAEVYSPNPANPLQVRLYKNDEGEGWEETRIQELDGMHGARIAAHDVTGDGQPELFVGSLARSFENIVWQRSPKGKWSPLPGDFRERRTYWSVDVCEGDGQPWLVAAEDVVGPEAPVGPRLFVLDDSRWKESSEGLPKMGAIDVACGDFDGDGIPEIAAVDPVANEISIHRRGAENRWSRWKTLTRPESIKGNAVGVTVADVDGDGTLDVVAIYADAEANGAIRVWLNR